MNNEAMKEVLNDLFSHLEKLETQTEAILQFLKEKKRVTDKQLAPYLEQAGNASSVRWRAARVRIDHLLSPGHPEKEVKLGKQPELREEPSRASSSRAGSSEDKQNEADDKEDRRTKSGDKESKTADSGDIGLQEQDKPAPAEAAKAHPADDQADRPEEKSESTQGSMEQPAQAKAVQDDKDKQESDSVHHPTEVTEPLAQHEGAEPAAQLNSKEKKSDQEAA